MSLTTALKRHLCGTTCRTLLANIEELGSKDAQIKAEGTQNEGRRASQS